MTKQEWDSLTEEERLKLFKELEEEKEAADKALEQFLKKESKRQDNEKWISIEGQYGQDIGLIVSDIEYIEAINSTLVRIYTKIIEDGKKIILNCVDRPREIVKKINGN